MDPLSPLIHRAGRFVLAFVALVAGCTNDSNGTTAGIVRIIGGAGSTDGRFVTPRGLDVANGRLWVVDKSGRLQTFGLDGTVLASSVVHQGRRGFPIGVLAEPDGAVLCDTHNNQLRFFDAALNQTGSLGEVGEGPAQFTYPQRAARSAAGLLYVTEYGNGDSNRVQVFDESSRFVRQFGGFGSEEGLFTRPMGIVVVEDDVFIADVSDRVIVYSTGGEFQREFGQTGSGRGELNYPYGLCVVEGMLYVCEYGNHRLQRFELNGRSRGTFGSVGSGLGEFHGPWDLAADQEGLLYVCDTGNHRVVVLDPQAIPWDEGRS